jgi:APA family basic amino acid/polyamine antiporter
MALLVLCFGAFDRILAYIIFSAICFLSLSAASLFRLKDPVRRWWYPLAPIVFLVGSGIIALLILMHDPLPALVGVAVVLCGDFLRRWFAPAKSAQAAEAVEPTLS